jgi:hypothetical protein
MKYCLDNKAQLNEIAKPMGFCFMIEMQQTIII